MNFETKYNVGDRLKDKVTGLNGICLGITLYATGCIHYGLQAQQKEGEQTKEWEWFDSSRLELVEENVISFIPENDGVSGAFPDPPKG